VNSFELNTDSLNSRLLCKEWWTSVLAQKLRSFWPADEICNGLGRLYRMPKLVCLLTRETEYSEFVLVVQQFYHTHTQTCRVFSKYFSFSVIIIPPMLYPHISFIYHHYDTILQHLSMSLCTTLISLFFHFNEPTLITEKPEPMHNLYYWLTVS
jgi:hypothetical protein